MKKKWYEKNVVIIALLILFFPVGLFLMWKYSNWNKAVKWIVTGLFGLVMINSAFSSPNTAVTTPQPTASPEQQVQEETVKEESAESNEIASPEPTKTPAKASTAPVVQTPSPTSTETVSQKNAVKKAQSYLDYTAFSRDGLVDQLVYEQFSQADAVYAADKVGADWNQQAAKKAQSYMDYSAFSRGSLIDQLKYDKFTQSQAEYGADAVGL